MSNLTKNWNQSLRDTFFDDFFQNMDPFRGITSMPSFHGSYDLEETEKAFLMTMDLPGVEKENLHVDIENDVLRIKATRDVEQKEKGTYGRFYGEFKKSFTLPSTVDADAVDAHYENGVLKIALPKKQELKGKKVEVKDKGNPSFWERLTGSKEGNH
mgnify:CR=1 FL=1|tara:strand:- start:14996 stop:15466 length:471 start_codon:yes stop_codon:yes gene_type:complete